MDGSTPERTRRSHPSLHHLSLNPLTSSSIPPTPSSPTLAPTTPSSYISPATTLPPSYPSILSRSSSRTKLRSPGPTPIQPTYENTSKSRPGSRHHSRRGTSNSTSAAYNADSSWLTRTASTLAMHSMEERGQSWLASRNSATTLHHYRHGSDEIDDGIANVADFDGGKEVAKSGYPRSTPASRYASRVQSRVGSRVGSRSDLRMTSAKIEEAGRYDGPRDDPPATVQAMEGMEPDFVDLDKRDREEEEVAEVVDEGEMRKLILGRVGGWVDWMVGWMDLRAVADGDEDEDDRIGDEEMDEMEEKGQEGRRPLGEGDTGVSARGSGFPAPDPSGGAWEDTKWLLKIAANSL
ncbi:MAG: hypothetical protein Q9221_001942 [Calogaya cf. arnoldii]